MRSDSSVEMRFASVRIYRMLLLAYPSQFRRMFQEEMAQTFRDCCRESVQQEGLWGLTRLWRLVLSDLIVTAFTERLRAMITWIKQVVGMTTDSVLISTGREQRIMTQFNLTVAQQTDIGLKRELNEDNMVSVVPEDAKVMESKGALFVVADGMGGHTNGEVASALAINTIREAYYHNPVTIEHHPCGKRCRKRMRKCTSREQLKRANKQRWEQPVSRLFCKITSSM